MYDQGDMKKGQLIILASTSPWRRRLLAKSGIRVQVHSSGFRELRTHIKPAFLARYNAVGKAKEVARLYNNAIIIGVDTIGVLRGKIILKPDGRADAKRMLQSLSGRTHRVISGLCVINTATGKLMKTAVTTKVTFRVISEEELERYLDSGQWKGKAGAYAVQARAKGFVAKIEGDITNVVGVPIATLQKILDLMRAKD